MGKMLAAALVAEGGGRLAPPPRRNPLGGTLGDRQTTVKVVDEK
jgi:hypothetical protein